MRQILRFAFLTLSAAIFVAASAQTAPTTAPALPREVPWIISPDISNAAPLTPETLETWLADKEIVELVFSGPHLDLATLPKVLQLPESVRGTFEITPGETGGGCEVRVRFIVSPDTIKRSLSLQSSLLPHNFHLDPSRATVFAIAGSPTNRQQGRRQLPDLLSALCDDLTKAFPGIQCKPLAVNASNDSWRVEYALPDSNVRGLIWANTIRLDRINMAAAAPVLSVDLRALGLTIELYTTSDRVNLSPQDDTVAKLLRQAIAPLVELDQKSLLAPAQTAPATRPLPAAVLRAATNSATQSAPPNAALLTADTLKEWLADKEIVSLVFRGPHTSGGAMEAFLPSPVPNSFTYGIAEGAADASSSIYLYLRADPENVKKLLDLQGSLALRGFRLDPTRANVITCQGNPADRQKAGQLLPGILASLREKLPTLVPGLQCTPFPAGDDSLGFNYALPNTDVRGAITAATLTVEWPTLSHSVTRSSLELRALGLIINNIPSSPRASSPQDKAIDQAFSAAFAPLVELDKSGLPPAPR